MVPLAVANPHGPLPFTGAALPAELGASALLLVSGLAAVITARRRLSQGQVV